MRGPIDEDVIALPIGGFYRYRSRRRDARASKRQLIHMLQDAVNERQLFAHIKQYSQGRVGADADQLARI